jgi:hypothetical protein
MRSQGQCIDLILLLVADPGVDHVLREDVAAEQELVVLAERRQTLRTSANISGASSKTSLSSGLAHASNKSYDLSGNTTKAANAGSVTGSRTSVRPTGNGPATGFIEMRTALPSYVPAPTGSP